MTESLWPDVIYEDLMESGPGKILKEQGEVLGRFTGKTVVGVTRTRALPENPQIVNVFQLFVPSLGYTYDLLHVSHTATQYPAEILLVHERVYNQSKAPNIVKNEDEFKSALRVIFASDDVWRIITLLKQEASNTADKDPELK